MLFGLLMLGNIFYVWIFGGWFECCCGVVYGIFGFGFGVGGLLVLYLGSVCIDVFGWCVIFFVYGLFEGFLVLLLFYVLFCE